jgi:hypothetical protein
VSTSHDPLGDSRLHRTAAKLTRHAGRLKQGALLLTALAAIYAIWLSVGLPALPITRGHTPDASGTPFVTQIDALTTPRIDTSALLTSRKALSKQLVRVPPRAAPHVARPTSHQPAETATTSPAPEHVVPADARGPAKAELTTETAGAPAAVKTSTTPTTPSPPTPTPPPTITLPQVPEVPQVLPLPQVPPLPQLPPLPQVPPLPQTPELPEVPPPPQVPPPSLPHTPALTPPALPQLP